MANFPTLTSRTEDSALYGVEHENPTIRSELDGGYVNTRARFTRTPRRIFSSGFTDISEADRLTLETFWDTVQGGSEAFNWTSPQDGNTYSVRFVEPLVFDYAGHGTNYRWNVRFKLEEV